MSAMLYAFRRNLVVAASAGTGKTHALVGVVVHLLLGASELGGNGLRDPIDPARVVATTFSRKAAAEIRARVVEALERLASGDANAPYRSDLAAACARARVEPWSDRAVAERARRVLDRVGRAQIGTLHGFASTIVRRFALELGLSPSLALEEDEETRARARAAIERMVGERFDANDATLRALVRGAGGGERLVEQIAQLLERLDEDGRGATELAIAEDDAAIIEARVRALIDAARPLADEPKLGPCARAAVAAFDADDASALEPALVDLVAQARRGKLSDAATAFFEARDALPTGGTNAERGRALARLFASREAFAEHARGARDLLAACEVAIRADARRVSALGFGDVLRAARDVLRDHPALAAELGAELDVLLVDEFQDTSRLQRDLVELVWEREPLARAPGAAADIARVRREGLFIVGDRKQSIYAFRGADVGVFTALCVGLAGAPARRALGIPEGAAWEPETPHADFVSLRHNRRSADELLDFANVFSARRLQPALAPQELYEIAYASAVEDLLPPPERAAATERTPRTTWLRVAITAERGKASRGIDEAYAIAERVQHLVAEGNGATRWRDCAVLAESNAMLDATAFALAQAGVPYVVAGSGFHAAREVRDIVAMLAVIVRESDALALLTVLRGPWAGVHDDTLIALTDPNRGLAQPRDWGHGVRRARIRPEDRATVARLGAVIESLRAHADALGAATTLREAVRALELEEVLVQLPRGAQRVANVRKLIQLAERAKSPRAFLESMRGAAEREARETEGATFADDDDAVRLLTVHASKGLAFPIVFVPEVGKGERPRDRSAIVIEARGENASRVAVRVALEGDASPTEPPSYERAMAVDRRRERAERARLAYVAITRAERALYLVGDRRVPRGGATEAYAMTNAALLASLADDDDARRAASLIVEPV
jgi:ATP-dependent helicase/nuclease subunit A